MTLQCLAAGGKKSLLAKLEVAATISHWLLSGFHGLHRMVVSFLRSNFIAVATGLNLRLRALHPSRVYSYSYPPTLPCGSIGCREFRAVSAHESPSLTQRSLVHATNYPRLCWGQRPRCGLWPQRTCQPRVASCKTEP